METNNNESVNDETIDNDESVNDETIDNDESVNDELYTYPHENIRQNNETFEVELFDTNKQKWIRHPKSSSFEDNKIRI